MEDKLDQIVPVKGNQDLKEEVLEEAKVDLVEVEVEDSVEVEVEDLVEDKVDSVEAEELLETQETQQQILVKMIEMPKKVQLALLLERKFLFEQTLIYHSL